MMSKKKLVEAVSSEKVFWVILESKDSIFSIDNVGGNRFYLVFSKKELAYRYYNNTDKLGYYWDTPVREKTWSEILSITGGDKRSVYYHFDLSPKATKIDTEKIICSK